MTRYVTRASVSIEDDLDSLACADRTTIVVHDRPDATATGLVDPLGIPIYRVIDRVPMGFRARSS